MWPRTAPPLQVRDQLKLMISSHSQYRAMCGYSCDAKHDRTWIGLLPPSGQELVRVVEGVVFKTTFYCQLKGMIKNGCGVDELPEKSPLKE
eukprot:6808004-Alexandrium_andersonii.AAC.1